MSQSIDIREENLNAEQLNQLRALLKDYKDIFADEQSPIGRATGIQHVVPLTTDQPIRVPYRRIPPNQIPEVKDHIDELLAQGVISPSSSPYAAAIVIVRNKNKSLRLCIAYRKLNKFTVRDAFPIPRIDESVEPLAGAKYFSTFDLAAGYHQIDVHPRDRQKTAFSTSFGHFEYNRLPMGLSNSQSTFQRSKCQESFDKLKVVVTTAPVLQCPDFEKEFILETDASFQGLRAVLSQKDEHGKIHPVCYASRGLRRSEKNMANYSSRKLELLALKWAVTNKFHNYLAGRHFTVYTDNSPLSHLETARLGAIESRWCNDLQQFNYTIKYKAGKDNTIADELSKLPQETEVNDTDEEYTVMSVGRDEMANELWSQNELKNQQEEMSCFEGIRKFLSR